MWKICLFLFKLTTWGEGAESSGLRGDGGAGRVGDDDTETAR